jgi:gliding motility-associated-like protein
MKMNLKNWIRSIAVFVGFTSSAQITIDNTLTPEELVQQVLLGTGVTVSNITFNGNIANAGNVQTNAGQFGGTSIVGLTDGLILSCGNIAEAVGPNTQAGASDNTGVNDYTTDPDLNALQTGGAAVHDGGVIEFDFVPQGDTISFQYAFASEEYPEFAPPSFSSYNDAFGFFLTGSNPAGGAYASQNIALLPDGITIVSIDNVNPQDNSGFYQDNAGGADLEYDGLTTLLTAKAAVECGETYHIKLAISDAGDNVYNSAVFIEANSFSSSIVQVSVATVTGDTTLVEGCGAAEIVFTRPEGAIGEADTISFDIDGMAVNGDDFALIDTFIIFPVGVDTIILALDPLVDGETEPAESVTITAYTINSCGDTIATSGTVYIIDEPDIQIALTDTLLNCPNDSVWTGALASGGLAPYEYAWDTGATSDSTYLEGLEEGDTYYLVTATDACGFNHTDSVLVTLNQAFFIDTILIQDSECTINPPGTGYVAAQMSPLTNPYQYEWTDATGSQFINASVWSDLSPGWYYYTVSFEGCTLIDSALVEPLNPPSASFTVTPSTGTVPFDVVFMNTSTDANSFSWDFVVSNIDVNNMNDQSATYTEEGDYVTSLIAYNDGGCSDTAYVTIKAVFYEPITFETPNVFTPDGDGINDEFFMNVENAKDYTIEIRNRWGNVVAELNENNPAWDGKTKSGSDVAVGTYFYSYTLNPIELDDEPVQGQGFVVIKRK